MKPYIAASILFALTGSSLAYSAPTAVGHDENVVVDVHYFGTRVSAKSEPTRIVCDKKAPNFLVALDGAMADRHIVVSKLGDQWHKEAFGIFGYTTKLPTLPADSEHAQRVLELLRRDNLASAKIANDEAATASGTYKASPFFSAAAQYIRNNTIPSLGDEQAPGAQNRAGSSGKEAAGQWLGAAATNLADAKRSLGPIFGDRAARYYVMGNAYDDGLAVDATARVLCGTKHSEASLQEIASVGAKTRTRKP